MHVHYKSLDISLSSSVKQQGETTKLCVVYGTWTTAANFSYFHLEKNGFGNEMFKCRIKIIRGEKQHNRIWLFWRHTLSWHYQIWVEKLNSSLRNCFVWMDASCNYKAKPDCSGQFLNVETNMRQRTELQRFNLLWPRNQAKIKATFTFLLA